MQHQSDAQLLLQYARQGSEAAFGEIVARHADLVYSAALRQVESPEQARDVAQTVFIDLAHKARSLAEKLPPDASLVGWLFRSTHFAALNVVRGDQRRQARERQAMDHLENVNPTSEAALDWEHVRPLLDEAISSLGQEDRDALLLRFFKGQDFRAVGLALGVSDDAAQKRVSRAVEKLRSILARRGITATASALSVAISAHAVQTAPVGLVTAISSTAVASVAMPTTTTLAVTKTIAMTMMQKTALGAGLAAAIAAGIYEARRTSLLRDEVRGMQQQQVSLTEKNEELMRERDDMARKLAVLRAENELLNRNTSELLNLRAQITRLRPADNSGNKSDVTEVAMKSWLDRVKEFKRLGARMPDKTIPELQLLTEEDWLELAKEPLDHSAKEVNLEDDSTARLVFSAVRGRAKEKLTGMLVKALDKYASANNGQLPTDMSQLKPYFVKSFFIEPGHVGEVIDASVDETILQRYQILQTGKFEDVPSDAMIIAERVPVDVQYDTRVEIGKFWMKVENDPEAYAQ